MELGIYTFADMQPEGSSGQGINGHQRLKDLMEEIEMADQLGLDVFAIGEHHRPEYAVSAPAVVLGAAAVKTKNIRLSSAVTVLSSDDPVRVFQDFATIDLLSGGRAEIMAGRGSFIESFPLFGYNLKDYEALFSEKLELLMKLNEKEKISWNGKLRPSIKNLGVYPRPYNSALPIWLAVGGTPESAVRAGMLGLPMALAIIGGTPNRFVSFVNLYRDAVAKAGRNPDHAPLSINSLAYVADNYEQAADEYFPYYSVMMNKIGLERGWSPIDREQFELMTSERGALLVGSPKEVTEKILYEYELFKNTRFLAQMSVGTMPHKNILRSIELFATKVAPEVRRALKGKI